MSQQMATAALRALREVVPRERVSVSERDRAAYSYDATYVRGRPDVVVSPCTTEEVAAVLRVAWREGLPVFARGAGTGLSGGSVPFGGIALVMTGMHRILSVEPQRMQIEVEAGVTTAAVQDAAREQGLFYPVDPGSQRVSTIGGNIAENAAGPRTLRFGTTASHLLGLTVVRADGTVLRLGGHTTKSATGYALTTLFAGSEGTLGVITEARLRLFPQPAGERAMLVAGYRDTAAVAAAILNAARSPAQPETIELLDRHTLAAVRAFRPLELPPVHALLLMEVHDYGPSLQARCEDLAKAVGERADFIRLARGAEELDGLRQMREAVSPAVARIKPTKISEDATVPIDEIGGFLDDLEAIRERFSVDLVVFGHAGDGNLHPNILCRAGDAQEMQRVAAAIDAIFEAALRRGGTLSGEHGVGILKRPYMQRAVPPETLQLMREIKDLMDPRGILNPGKLLPQRENP